MNITPANVLLAVTVIIIVVITGINIWRRCITANHAKMSWQDHQDRIGKWKSRMQGCLVAGFSLGSISSIVSIVTKSQFLAAWTVQSMSLIGTIFLLMIFPLELHILHQNRKSRPQ